MLGFGILEHQVCSDEVSHNVSHARYGVHIPILMVCAPLALLRALEPLRQCSLDELILSVFIISLLLLLIAIGPVAIQYGDDIGMYVDAGAILLGMPLLFFVNHMRFLLATAVSMFCVVGSLLSGHVRDAEEPAAQRAHGVNTGILPA